MAVDVTWIHGLEFGSAMLACDSPTKQLNADLEFSATSGAWLNESMSHKEGISITQIDNKLSLAARVSML